MQNERREFLKRAGLLVGAGLSLPVISSFVASCERNEGPLINQNSTMTLKISDYPILETISNSVKVSESDFNNGMPVIIIRTGAESFLTFSSVCTHEGCELELPNSGKIECGCHGSIFSAADGTVMQKPMDNSDIQALPKFQNSYNSLTGILSINS